MALRKSINTVFYWQLIESFYNKITPNLHSHPLKLKVPLATFSLVIECVLCGAHIGTIKIQEQIRL